MAHIISRVFKPSVCKNLLRHTNVRMFSSTTPHTSGLDSNDETKVTRPFSSKPAYPFLLIDYILKGPDSCSDGRVTTYNGKEVFINDKKLMEEVCDAMTVGFSRDGLRFYLSYRSCDHAPVINYETSNPKVEDMTVHLPSLPAGSKIQNMEDDEPKYIDLEFDNLPKSVIHELADVSSCSRTDHLVESPTGQLFLVKWYSILLTRHLLFL
ncbi:hypothetical protein ARALYDRAFT_915460 [Arabidopsis lyrata subsp. lyrata]|uniref:Uncharacterized protein n=1 Tax=Arabidopsis lyrata subsp. lyrata TaxID=81972 RepID=D7MH48_ARALL|nr:hypothetical protein ARALYDRAFT_915460 [Arabidopsis lyrata subsp. lyrata]